MSATEETRPAKSIAELVRYLFCSFAEVNRIAEDTDSEFQLAAMRRWILEASRKVIPGSIAAVAIQRILEYLFQDPAKLPLVLGIFAIIGTIYRVIVIKKNDDYWLRWNAFRERLRYRVEDILRTKTLSLDLARTSDPETADLKEKAENGARDAVEHLWVSQKEIASSALTVLVALIGVLLREWRLAIFVAGPIIGMEVRRALLNKRRQDAFEKTASHDRKLRGEYARCLTSRSMVFQARLFGIVEYLQNRYESLRHALYKRTVEYREAGMATGQETFYMRTACITGATIFLVFQVKHGRIAVGELLFVSGLLSALADAVMNCTRAVRNAFDEAEDLENFQKYLGVESLIDERHAEAISLDTTPQIIIDDVIFAYPEANTAALMRCSLTIEPGEKVAIVGSNGSGKTTIANLLAKLYVPKEGCVKVGGISLMRFTQKSWVKHLLYVTAQTALPDFPIDEVVAGVQREEIDLDRLIEAAKITGVHDFVKGLPWKYGTPIGTKFPGGRSFSTGQLQRIRLAAGVYRLLGPEVRIAVFDEPMANCDHDIREKFYGSIRGFSGKTVVVIAHDPTYLHHFDRVIVMAGGKVGDDIRGSEAVNKYKMQIVGKTTSS